MAGRTISDGTRDGNAAAAAGIAGGVRSEDSFRGFPLRGLCAGIGTRWRLWALT
ncbi:hypothetical protein [Bradyrhizobium sp. Leo121]|uniref:hypothetical protein n=1 Tax=Bradyrhizobium sp. Leo121 TaxID=1571195 RepID=UPI00041DD90D|nr:hypothetical protein [Bradyrhizobium sp. Leo121]